MVRESVLGSRRDRPLELDSAAEPPTARRRINERGAEVSVRRGKLSRDEKSVLSAGNKKGTAVGKTGKSLDEQELKKVFLRTKLGKDKPDLFPFYLEGYRKSHGPALGQFQSNAAEEVERLGKINGANAARQGGVVLKSKDDLVAWYEESHPGAGYDAAKAYAESYVKAYNGR